MGLFNPKDIALVVVDVESTCWKGTPPPGQKAEIIEIGIAIVNYLNLEITERRQIYVKPRISEVSLFCTELTGITQEFLDEKGVPFEKACKEIMSLRSKRKPWGSWGNYDRNQFQRDCKKIDSQLYPFGPSHLNIKNLFTLLLGEHKEYGMHLALIKIGLPLEGKHHCGCDDAYNIARIFCYIAEKFRKK